MAAPPSKFTDKEQLHKLHNATLDVLRDVGMRIDETRVIETLRKKGCKVDPSDRRIYFLPELVEETIGDIKNDIENGTLTQIVPKRASPATQKVRGQRSEVRNFSGDCIIAPNIRPIWLHSAVISACSVSVM